MLNQYLKKRKTRVGTREGRAASEHLNGPSGYTTGGEFTDQLNDRHIFNSSATVVTELNL
jgi:hypothetical protein